jgi:molybdate transport system regulatory protein
VARVRLHIHLDGEHSLGPGKIQLLEGVREHGSISAAARALEMAYRHAWELIDDLNQGLGRAVVETASGGAAGGGARLTPFGEEVVRRFRTMEAKTESAIAADLRALGPQLARRGISRRGPAPRSR